MQWGPPRLRRPRPVADAPIDALLVRTEELTKGWLLALLELAPLQEASGILAADVTRDGPRICDAIVRALAEEDDLRRLEPGGALELLVSRAGELAGARSLEAGSRAVDALHAVIWSAVREELRRPDPDQLSELSERLGLAIELVRGATLRRHGGERPAAAVADADADADAAVESEAVADAPAAEPSPEGALWVSALEEEIQHCRSTGTPLSLLLAELEDATRVAAVEADERAAATFGRFAQAVRSALRRQDILVSETDARVWIIARDTGRAGAQALGARLASTVREAQPWRGAPMAASVGFAVLGEDGERSGDLIEAAEENRFAAAASGIAIIRAVPPEDAPEPPSGPMLAS
ncbi:MAG: hypothetical protein JO156_06540 [Solirubrobacterales bacterium]|nr:hypothetical protein [Solirubrobacterales bacterium]